MFQVIKYKVKHFEGFLFGKESINMINKNHAIFETYPINLRKF